MPSASSWRTAVVGSALIAAAVSACQAQTTETLPPAPAPTPTASAALHLPIEAYMLTPQQGAQLSWEENRAIRSCMARFGIDYPQAEPRPTGPAAGFQYAVLYRRYGIDDQAGAATWGYHPPLPGQPTPTGARRQAPALPTAAQDVLNGNDSTTQAPVTSYQGKAVPPGGCVKAGSELFPTVNSPQGPGAGPGQLIATIKSESYAHSLSDSRVTRVFASWQACMASRGYRLQANPLHATAGLASTRAAVPDRTEIAQAEADVTCKQQTHLIGVWFAVESDYQNLAIQQNRAALDDIRGQRDAVTREIREHATP